MTILRAINISQLDPDRQRFSGNLPNIKHALIFDVNDAPEDYSRNWKRWYHNPRKPNKFVPILGYCYSNFVQLNDTGDLYIIPPVHMSNLALPFTDIECVELQIDASDLLKAPVLSYFGCQPQATRLPAPYTIYVPTANIGEFIKHRLLE